MWYVGRWFRDELPSDDLTAGPSGRDSLAALGLRCGLCMLVD